MSDRKIIRVSAETEAAIRDYAEGKGLQVGEAADKLVGTAVARLGALKRYSANKQPQAPGKPKKKAKASAKSATKKVAKKAKSTANGAAEHVAQA